MIRNTLIVLVLLAALGGAGYYFLGNKEVPRLEDANVASAAQAAPGTNPDGSPAEYWTKRCEEKTDYCEIFQRLMIKENNQRLIEFAVGYPKEADGVAQAAIILPLGVTLTDGITIKVDDQSPAVAKYRSCGPQGCFVVLTLPDSFVQSMSSGKIVSVSFLEGAGKTINIEMSLDGFGAKLKDVKA